MFRLRLRLPSGPLTLNIPETQIPTTFGGLTHLIASNIQPPPDASKGITIKVGYPPKALTLAHEAPIQQHVKNGDTLIVTVGDASPNRQTVAPAPKKRKTKKASSGTASSSSSSSSSSSNSNRSKSRKTTKDADYKVTDQLSGGPSTSTAGTRRSKRAASHAATAAMPALVREQERLMKQTSASSSSSRNRAKPKRSNKPPVPKKTGIHGLRPTATSSSSASRPSKKRKRTLGLASKTDASAKLVGALNGSGNKDLTSQFFRMATKSAVLKAYERTRGLKRVVSAMKGDYTIVLSTTARRLNDGAADSMAVTFRKGKTINIVVGTWSVGSTPTNLSRSLLVFSLSLSLSFSFALALARRTTVVGPRNRGPLGHRGDHRHPRVHSVQRRRRRQRTIETAQHGVRVATSVLGHRASFWWPHAPTGE
jgi:hypothetical protein